MPPISPPRYARSRIAEAESGGPSSGDGAGPLSIWASQMLFGRAETETLSQRVESKKDRDTIEGEVMV